jgi:NRPS condensation-like uncharacterized protein
LPASAGQRRLWSLDQLHGQSASYTVPYLVRLAGELDRDALRQALAGVVARHEILRTRFEVRDGEMVQVIGETADVDLSVTTGEDAQRRLEDQARRPFSLTAGPLLRVRLAQVGPRQHLLLIAFHHAIVDG